MIFKPGYENLYYTNKKLTSLPRCITTTVTLPTIEEYDYKYGGNICACHTFESNSYYFIMDIAGDYQKKFYSNAITDASKQTTTGPAYLYEMDDRPVEMGIRFLIGKRDALGKVADSKWDEFILEFNGVLYEQNKNDSRALQAKKLAAVGGQIKPGTVNPGTVDSLFSPVNLLGQTLTLELQLLPDNSDSAAILTIKDKQGNKLEPSYSANRTEVRTVGTTTYSQRDLLAALYENIESNIDLLAPFSIGGDFRPLAPQNSDDEVLEDNHRYLRGRMHSLSIVTKNNETWGFVSDNDNSIVIDATKTDTTGLELIKGYSLPGLRPTPLKRYPLPRPSSIPLTYEVVITVPLSNPETYMGTLFGMFSHFDPGFTLDLTYLDESTYKSTGEVEINRGDDIRGYTNLALRYEIQTSAMTTCAHYWPRLFDGLQGQIIHLAVTIDPSTKEIKAYITPLSGPGTTYEYIPSHPLFNFFTCNGHDHTNELIDNPESDGPKQDFWNIFKAVKFDDFPELCLGGDMRTCLKRIDIEDGTIDSVFKNPAKWYGVWRWNNFRYFRGAIHSYALFEDCKDANTIATHAQAMLAPLKVIQD